MAKKLPDILLNAMTASRLKGPGFAKKLQVNHQTLYGWLLGQHVPPRREAERLAKRLRRPDLVDIIDSDRQLHRREVKAAAKAARAGVE